MYHYQHLFHIPVMGTGHSANTPICVAPLGITSVISLVDDLLLERIREYYSKVYDLVYRKIPREEEDGRAKRITAYLETVQKIVSLKMENIKKLSFYEDNDKRTYFELLPDQSPLKKDYRKLLQIKAGSEKKELEKNLTQRMHPGSIDVNIMVKLDKSNSDRDGNLLGNEYSDAKAALRGYAKSSLRSSIVFSAGINQGLFSYMSRFSDFYRDALGQIKKKIILKVSDFRSALIQGKFLARKGLAVFEFRIESGLNCGGHAFPSNGYLLPSLLQEMKVKRNKLVTIFQPMVQKFYKKMGWEYPESALTSRPLITVQGGIGTHGEMQRLIEDFKIDLTGWATPFLLVPEATAVDNVTLKLLREATDDDVYISNVSPLEIPFNNVHGTGSEIWTRKMVEKGKPGSPCHKGFLALRSNGTGRPVCLASRKYQKKKLEEINALELSDKEKEKLRSQVTEKACLCDHLGNGILIKLGIADKSTAPQSICPGPNIAWFKKCYSLKKMVDHIYGRGPSLVPMERPHMFAKEVVLYVDYFEQQVAKCNYTPKEIKTLKEFKTNLEDGMAYCLEIAQKKPYPHENLASIPQYIKEQKSRLLEIYESFLSKTENQETK